MKAVAVFCSASAASVAEFQQPAAELARQLAESGIEIVYGGSNCGLMGVVADAALAAGGKVRGVIPTVINETEIEHPDLTELIVVESMHQRKKMMFDMSDAIVILPGGLGTLDELVEALTWKQLGIHDIPVYILRTGDFWDLFLEHVDRLVERDLLHGHENLFEVFDRAEDLLNKLKVVNVD